MDIKCPHCGTEYEVEQKDMYRYTKCSVCGKGFVVGADSSLFSSAPSSPKPSVASRTPTSSTPPRQRKTPIPRSRPSSAKSFTAGMRQTEKPAAETPVDSSSLPPYITESDCLKTWVKYWLARLLIVFGVSLLCGFVCGFVGSVTGTAPLIEWPKEGAHRMVHIVVYVVMALGVYGTYELAFLSYKRYAVRNLFLNQQTCNVVSSWIVPILVNVALSLLMAANIQIVVLGIYGCIVWSLTIWVVVDYCMFRFISVKLLAGQKVDGRWISPVILFCIFIVMMYGVSQVNKEIRDGFNCSSATLKRLDESRHHDAKQIYDRMGLMKLY